MSPLLRVAICIAAIAGATTLGSCAVNSGTAGMHTSMSVRAAHAGIRCLCDKNGVAGNDTALVINEPTGTRETLTWHTSPLSQPDSVRKLQACLQASRQRVRFSEIRLTPKYTVTTPNSMKRTVLGCIQSAGLAPYEETVQPDETEYFVNIGVHWPSHPQEDGRPAPDRIVEARRWIQRSTTNATLVLQDVRECFVSASASTAWRISSESTTIQPLTDRFDQCIRAKSYTVEQPAAQDNNPEQPG